MHCGLVDDDGGCDSVRVYVWSDEDHMDQPTINEIYHELQKVCVDPTDLIFLNTFRKLSICTINLMMFQMNVSSPRPLPTCSNVNLQTAGAQ